MHEIERPKVFLVDDNVGLRSMLRELLAEAGVEVVGEADNGTAALRYIPGAACPGGLVVLMDVRMPGPVNGIEATRLLVGRCERLGVIVFTAFPGSGIEQAAIAAGAVDVLVKGAPAETIAETVRRTWSRMVAVAT
jgi:two-component system, NarL family, invasion response regulator UvrY